MKVIVKEDAKKIYMAAHKGTPDIYHGERVNKRSYLKLVAGLIGVPYEAEPYDDQGSELLVTIGKVGTLTQQIVVDRAMVKVIDE